MPTNEEKKNVTVQLFFAEWCGHCRQFKPEWENLKIDLEKNGMAWEEYEADKDSSKMEEESIKGFPTIRIIASRGKQEYSGPRTADAIIAFIKQGPRAATNGKFKQCGGGKQGFSLRKKNQKNDEFYKVKYLKYKAKYMRMKAELER